MVPAVRADTYPVRLQKLNLWSLEERRNRADLIAVYKMKQGYSKLCFEDLFEVDTSRRSCGLSCKLKCNNNHGNKDLRRFFFSQRVVNRWNGFSEDRVLAITQMAFKSRLIQERKRRMDLFTN
jgi:hypothetical protein